MYDLAIIGGGPAGVAAGVYASRKQLKTLIITESFGGQSMVSDGIENWIGTIKISGIELAESLKNHLKAYAKDHVDIKEGELVSSIKKVSEGFEVSTQNNKYLTKTILIATGSHRRKLDIPGASEFENKGISYCASCDGPFFTDKDTVVIGGGNAAFEAAAQLQAYAKSVTILNRSQSFKADPVTIEKISKNPKVKILINSIPVEIKGDKFAKSIVYQNAETKETNEIPAEGIFVEIGLIPNTEFLKELLEINAYGQIIIDPRTQQTKTPGIWASGDCTDSLYHQNNIAAGDAVRALEDIYVSLHTK
ncbi:MAG: FAD-dependent oxidoreductase [Candidatus Paceibacterota bacterium]